MDNSDIKIKVPQTLNGDLEEQSIKSLFEECEKVYQKYASPYLTQAEFNERLIAGEQFIDLTGDWLIRQSDDMLDIRSSRNLMKNLSLTWSAKILEDRPSIACYPAEPGSDLKKAQAATKILEFVKQNQDFDDLCFGAAQLVQPHSAVGFKIVWDPLTGPLSKGVPTFDSETGLPALDELGNPVLSGVGKPLGDVSWSVVSIFDFYTDGSENVEDSRWVLFTKLVDEWEAKRLLASVGIEEDPSVEEENNIWGIPVEGVRVKELWLKPGDFRFPNGLFAVIIGDKVIQAIDYPYDHGELPIAVWKCNRRRSSPFGSTHVDDAAYIQKVINMCVTALNQQAKQIASIDLIAHTSVIQAKQNGNKMIPVDDPTVAQYARYIEPPDRARVLVSTLEDNVKALYDVWGLNELLTGADSMKSGTAAKSIAYLNKLDSMKLSGASRSLSKAILRIMRQTLKLYQQFVKAPRLAQIIGSNNIIEPVLFKNADIAGVDVRMEPISGLTQYRASVVEEAQMGMQAQGPTPELMSESMTGLKQTAYDKSQREIVSAQIEAIIKGQQAEADPQIDSNIATDEILSVLSQYYGTPAGNGLFNLLQQYRANSQPQQPEGQQ